MGDSCLYCGDEPCDLELHNPRRVRDLLIDAGIIDESDEQWNAWLTTPIGENAKGRFSGLEKVSPLDLYNIHFRGMIAYARSIL